VILQRYDTPADAAKALAGQVIAALRVGQGWRGRASLVVPGGRTPVSLFRALRDVDLDWGHVGITLTDERWVPESDPASNAALVRSELLAGRAGIARFVPLFSGAATAAEATSAVWKSLSELPRPFDAVVLGMGDGGHFASLFPESPGVQAALDPGLPPGCVAMRGPAVPTERISLNLAALLQTRRLFLFVTGAAKRELLLAAARGEPGTNWPVMSLLAQRHPLTEVFWAP
jgi:6-phosphogluconolactonase